jgi:hypothetical protein
MNAIVEPELRQATPGQTIPGQTTKRLRLDLIHQGTANTETYGLQQIRTLGFGPPPDCGVRPS